MILGRRFVRSSLFGWMCDGSFETGAGDCRIHQYARKFVVHINRIK